jgi:hypothetical protein
MAPGMAPVSGVFSGRWHGTWHGTQIPKNSNATGLVFGAMRSLPVAIGLCIAFISTATTQAQRGAGADATRPNAALHAIVGWVSDLSGRPVAE